jgi:hypothetical protein
MYGFDILCVSSAMETRYIETLFDDDDNGDDDGYDDSDRYDENYNDDDNNDNNIHKDLISSV